MHGSKPHYVYRGGYWWQFWSLEIAREFLSTAEKPGGYRFDLEPMRVKPLGTTVRDLLWEKSS